MTKIATRIDPWLQKWCDFALPAYLAIQDLRFGVASVRIPAKLFHLANIADLEKTGRILGLPRPDNLNGRLTGIDLSMHRLAGRSLAEFRNVDLYHEATSLNHSKATRPDSY